MPTEQLDVFIVSGGQAGSGLHPGLVSRTEAVRRKDQLLARVPDRIPERAATGEDAPQDARTGTPRGAPHDRIHTPRQAQRTLRGQPGNASGARWRVVLWTSPRVRDVRRERGELHRLEVG